MTTIVESIEAALFAAVRDLDTFADAAKAWPNVNFTPANNATYLRVDHLPNQTERLFLAGSDPHLRRGILQLTVVSPLNAGAQPATALAGAVAAEFPADRVLYSDDAKVRIERAPDVAPAFRDDHSWRVPVSVRYECFG